MSIRKWSFITASAAAMLAAGGAYAQNAAAGAEVEAVVVTGSRLQSAGFSAPSPVSTVNAERLEQRALTSVGEAVQELPSFSPGGQSQAGGGTLGVGQATMDLRGLGSTRTLVLVNGIRPTPVNVTGTYDANMLPSALVDRTEVVTGGASAAYGSDAVAGVVNFILKERMEGFKGNVQYGISQQGDGRELSGSLAWGGNFGGDKLHVIGAVDYSKQNATDTMYSRDWGKREPGVLTLTTRPAGTPANITGDGVEYSIATGGLITSCVRGTTVLSGAACPFNNTTFNASGQPIPFQLAPLSGSTLMKVPTAAPGTYQYGVSLISAYRMRAGGERKVALLKATYDITDNTSAWGMFNYGWYQVDSYGNLRVRNANTILVDRNNPYIPAATAAAMDAQGITQLRMGRVLAETEQANPQNRNDTTQFTGGLRGEIGNGWRWDVTAATGKSHFKFETFGTPQLPNFYASMYAVRDASGQIVCGPLATNPNRTQLTALQQTLISTGCVPSNPFGQGSISKAALDYFMPGAMISEVTFKRNSAIANISGEAFTLPAGPVAVSAGIEWHEDDVFQAVDDRTQALSLASAWFVVNPVRGGGVINAKEAYGEIGVPVFRDILLTKALDLNGAIRRTKYNTSGSVTTWKYGATWDITDWLRLRATKSLDIRAPNVQELYIKGGDSNGTRVNPLTGVSSQVNGSSVPNINLKPEEAHTFTGGVVFQPPSGDWGNFRMSADYYDIQIKGVIAALAFDEVLRRYYINKDQSVAGFITFDNSAIGFSRVESPLFNLNSRRINGMDIEWAYRLPRDVFGIPGQFTLGGNGSFLNQSETFDGNGNTLNDLAGAFPEWRWNNTINYELDRFGAGLTVKSFSQVSYRRDLVGPDSPNYNPAATNSVSRNVWPSFAYLNLNIKYTILQEDSGRKLDAYMVIDNLLDSDPPHSGWGVFTTQGQGGSGGYNPWDGVGRYFKTGLRFQF